MLVGRGRSAGVVVCGFMGEEYKLRQKLARHRAVLRLTNDRRAVAALHELIQRTRDRLRQIRKQADVQAKKV